MQHSKLRVYEIEPKFVLTKCVDIEKLHLNYLNFTEWAPHGPGFFSPRLNDQQFVLS